MKLETYKSFRISQEATTPTTFWQQHNIPMMQILHTKDTLCNECYLPWVEETYISMYCLQFDCTRKIFLLKTLIKGTQTKVLSILVMSPEDALKHFKIPLASNMKISPILDTKSTPIVTLKIDNTITRSRRNQQPITTWKGSTWL